MCLESSMKKVVSATQLDKFKSSPLAHKLLQSHLSEPASMQGGEPTTRMVLVQQVVGEREEVSNSGSRAVAGGSPVSGRLTPSAPARHLANR